MPVVTLMDTVALLRMLSDLANCRSCDKASVAPVSRALSIQYVMDGMAIDIKMATIATPTISSISVTPAGCPRSRQAGASAQRLPSLSAGH